MAIWSYNTIDELDFLKKIAHNRKALETYVNLGSWRIYDKNVDVDIVLFEARRLLKECSTVRPI